jgi:hypothetical protein
VTADGAYGGAPTYQTIAMHGDGIEVVIPPRSTAVPNGEHGAPTQRDRHLAMITEHGRLAWQVATNYGQRSLIETTMGRYKVRVGPRMRARGFAAQQTEAAIGVAVLNRMLAAGPPNPSVAPRHRMADRDRGHLEPHPASAPTPVAGLPRRRGGHGSQRGGAPGSRRRGGIASARAGRRRSPHFSFRAQSN